MSNLTPELIADVLERQGEISKEQATQLRHEARLLPKPGARAAYEQRSVAYDLVSRLAFPASAGPARWSTRTRSPRRSPPTPGSPTSASTRSSSTPTSSSRRCRGRSRARHRMIPLEMTNGKLASPAPTPSTSRASTPSAASPAATSSSWSPPSPTSCARITEFYGLRHSVKRAERDLPAGIDLGNLEQLVRMKSETEIESSDAHIVNAVEFMLQHAYDTPRVRHPHRAQARRRLIRFRIDGVLHDIQTHAQARARARSSRASRRCARLDIAEKRRPQDGRVKTERARPGGRAARLDAAGGLRREGRDAHLRSRGPDRRTCRPRLLPRRAGASSTTSSRARTASSWSPARPARARPPRSTRRCKHHRHPRDQHHHDRGPDRDGVRGVQPDRGADQDRDHLRRRAAPHPAPGPRRHHGRRDPRPGDGAVRDPGRAHRPPGLLHPAHQRRRRPRSRAWSTSASSPS